MEEIEKNETKIKKRWLITIILCTFFGTLGIHRFYNRKIGTGILQLLTFGGLGIWTIIDLINIARNKFKDKDGKIIVKNCETNYKSLLIICILLLTISCICLMFNIVRRIKLERNIRRNEIVNLINDASGEIKKIPPGLQVFMQYDATDEQIYELKNELNQIEGITNIAYVSKEDAYNTMKEKLGENKKALDGFEPDMFAVSFIVEINNEEDAKDIERKIASIANVRSVSSNVEVKETAEKVQQSVKKVNKIIEYYSLLIIWLIILQIIQNIISIGILCKTYSECKE